jgi:hypothetical protein
MTHDDPIYRHRLRLFARAGEVGVSDRNEARLTADGRGDDQPIPPRPGR